MVVILTPLLPSHSGGRTLTGLTSGKGLAAGDSIRIIGSAAPVSSAISATWTSNSRTVTLASPLTTTLYMDGAWTAATNVTASLNTTAHIEGSNCTNLNVAAGFTTGIVGYYATGTLDLSTKQQISLNIQASIAVASGVLRLDLCSDTVGAVPVHSFTLNRGLNASRNTRFVFDNGSALNSSIKSISIVAISDPGTVNLAVDAIWASTAPGTAGAITARSLVNKAGDANWYAISACNGTTITLQASAIVAANATNQTGWSGTTGSGILWHRETVMTDIGTSNATINTPQVAGTVSLPITLSGGWNRTDMSTQTLETYLDGNDGNGWGINLTQNYWNWSNIHGCRFSSVVQVTANFVNHTGDMHVTSCGGSPFAITTTSRFGKFCIGGTYYHIHNSATTTWSGHSWKFGDVELRSMSGSAGLTLNGADLSIGSIVARTISNNSPLLFTSCGKVEIESYNADFSDSSNTSTAALGTSGTGNDGLANYIRINSMYLNNVGWLTVGIPGRVFINNLYMDDWNFGPASSIAGGSFGGISGYVSNWAHSDFATWSGRPWYTGKYFQMLPSNVFFSTDNAELDSQGNHVWVFNLPTAATAANGLTSEFPAQACEPILKYVPANTTLTVTAKVKRNETTDMAIRLRVIGGRIAGIPNDVTATSASSTDNAWETITLSVTPTESAFIEIQQEAYALVGTFTTASPGPKAWIKDIRMSLNPNSNDQVPDIVYYQGNPVIIGQPSESSFPTSTSYFPPRECD